MALNAITTYEPPATVSTATYLGPLTTYFEAPASCLSILSTVTSGVNVYGLPELYFGHINSEGHYDCYPGTSISSMTNFWSNYYYSPAVCPSGWQTACAYSEVDFPSQTTVSLCCPDGFTCFGPGNGQDHACSSATTSSGYPDLVYIDGIPVAWQSTDTEILSLLGLYTAPSSSPSSSPPITVTEVLTTTVTASSSASPSNLPTYTAPASTPPASTSSSTASSSGPSSSVSPSTKSTSTSNSTSTTSASSTPATVSTNGSSSDPRIRIGALIPLVAFFAVALLL